MLLWLVCFPRAWKVSTMRKPWSSLKQPRAQWSWLLDTPPKSWRKWSRALRKWGRQSAGNRTTIPSRIFSLCWCPAPLSLLLQASGHCFGLCLVSLSNKKTNVVHTRILYVVQPFFGAFLIFAIVNLTLHLLTNTWGIMIFNVGAHSHVCIIFDNLNATYETNYTTPLTGKISFIILLSQKYQVPQGKHTYLMYSVSFINC